MIGVLANPPEVPVIREFFELFKTPWELYRTGRRYNIVLSTRDCSVSGEDVPLALIYSGRELACDAEAGIEPLPWRVGSRMLSYKGAEIPVYGDSIVFAGGDGLTDGGSGEALMCLRERPGGVTVRIGYDLFEEVRALLTAGQPAANAAIPALDLHIAVLRDLLVAHAGQLVEIRSVPQGYRFLTCLTHDMDHPSLRLHGFDATLLGFLYRATVCSLVRVLRGRLSWWGLLRNWIAALKTPLVQAGLAQDPWRDFVRYLKLEKGLPSTFFAIPFPNRPGQTQGGQPAPKRRACRYRLADINEELRQLMAGGCEIGLHGIDAWRDRGRGSEELAAIRQVNGAEQVGVRMHWLYFDTHSPATLEAGGADYDSTVGYNETIGYRAGTAQAYKPLKTERLLELPMHVMDTALFYPSYLNLTPNQARRRVGRLLDHAQRYGGCVVVNWHDRSIAAERQWSDFYVNMVEEMERREAWFASASQAVAWFRMRRSAQFESVSREGGAAGVRIAMERSHDLPDLQLRIYDAPGSYRDIPAAEFMREAALHSVLDTDLKTSGTA